MSELAKKLIAENKRTKASSLDLGNCGLKEVPAELGELVWLNSLASEWSEWDGNMGNREKVEMSSPPTGAMRVLRAS